MLAIRNSTAFYRYSVVLASGCLEKRSRKEPPQVRRIFGVVLPCVLKVSWTGPDLLRFCGASLSGIGRILLLAASMRLGTSFRGPCSQHPNRSGAKCFSIHPSAQEQLGCPGMMQRPKSVPKQFWSRDGSLTSRKATNIKRDQQKYMYPLVPKRLPGDQDKPYKASKGPLAATHGFVHHLRSTAEPSFRKLSKG